MKNTGLVAVNGDSVVRILRVESDASNISLKRAFCKRDDGERQFWAKIHRGKHENDYIMSRGSRHYLMREQEARK
jgi:hypothetical protein